jgi:hypothetical protein
MAFYIRKSLRFGPVRFNLSKSGVGVSAGIKGFRVGGGPRGNYVHMGRHGLYYRATLPSGAKHSPSNSPNTYSDSTPAILPEENIVMEEIDSGDVGEIVDSSSSDLVNELNTKNSRTPLAPIVAIIGLVVTIGVPTYFNLQQLIIPLAVVFAVAFVFLAILDRNRKTTVIFYELDDSVSSIYKSVYEAFVQLGKSKKIWHISAKGDVNDSKYHAGANQVVKRSVSAVHFSNPKNVKTNIPTPNIKVGTQTLFFFPDKLLIFDKTKIGGLSYENVEFDVGTTHFVEDEGVPRDSQVVDRTWKYVNKKGGPDKRFKDNREIPVAEYQTVHFTSTSGLNELIHIPKVGIFASVITTIDSIIKFTKNQSNNIGIVE